MHATHILDKHLRIHCQGTHKRRMDAVMSMVKALLHGRVLTVTGLGRSLQEEIAPKHQIKKADRLIGNIHLHNEREEFYRALIRLTVGNLKHPVILVDWSDVSDDRVFQKLRASMAVEGRALTLYEEVHPQSKSANRRVHDRFLKTLQRLLPEQCSPIIVTDAGFKNPWFKAVTDLGWDYVGRVGGHIMLRDIEAESAWQRVEQLFASATQRACYYGEIELARANPLHCFAYTLKRKPVGRVKKTKSGKKSAMKHSLKNAHRERTPWVLVTSLQGGRQITKAVIRLYKSRMQIEEAFRDLKNHRYGFSFRDCMSRQLHRLENLLLIGALSTLVAWLVGKAAELKGLHRQFQANTTKTRSVLSTIYLGCEVISSMWFSMTSADFRNAITVLREDRYAISLAV